MKKITVNIIIGIMLVMCLMTISVAANNEKTTISDEAVNVIKLLEIANGDQNGNMNYSSNVTRAEFVKMTVNASTDKNLASNTKLNVSIFPDVRNTHWAASYVSVAINRGLVNGYLDGTFKPSNPVTLEEAATIVLRLLGYSNNDLIGNYPTAQLNKYKELDLDENITAEQGDKMTREQCMILIYNMLSTKTKSGIVYCTTLGYTADAEEQLDYSELLKKELDGPFISDGVSDSFEGFVPNESTVYMLNNNKCASADIKQGDVIYTNDVINSIYAYRKTATGIVTYSSESMVTLGTKNYSISTTKAKQKLALGGSFSHEKAFVTLLLGIDDVVVDVIEGDITLLDSNSDNATYLEMIDATISTPVYINNEEKLASWKNNIPFSVDSAKVYFNGKEMSNYLISLNDVIYYSEPFKSVWIFRDTQSGVIASVSQNAVTIGSGTYILATNDSKLKVSTYGEYSENDYVTLILGKNDEVIDIVDADTTSIGSTDKDSSYAEVVSGTLKGPYVVSADGSMENLKLDAENATVFLENSVIDSTDILPYDVYYFSEVLNSVWIYRDRESGTIEAVTPVSSPMTVVLSGKTYHIDSSNASYELSSFGSFDVGDKATLLLGMDEKVAGIVRPEVISSESSGVIIDKGEKMYTDKNGNSYTSNYLTVVDATGSVHTYQYSKNSFKVGDVVKVYISDNVQISRVSSEIVKSEAAKLARAINEGGFTDNCNIIDISGTNILKVYPQRLSGCEIDAEHIIYTSSVLYYEFEDGLIKSLILNDFTGDTNDYGIVTSSKLGTITYLDNSNVEKVITSGSNCSVGAAKLIKENGAIVSATALTGVIDNIDHVTSDSVVDERGNSYKLSDNIRVYIKETTTHFEHVELGEVLNGSYNLKAYYDKLPEYGGRIRVIIATKNV
ncbi:MAG: S-layer homology domain-containing protein [Ruminococcaceae bacterium]|nr:S-layer homology domain-containing protein [Oscillospiraceae bacterium]